MHKPITFIRLQVRQFWGVGVAETQIKLEENCLYCRSSNLTEEIAQIPWRRVKEIQPVEWNRRLEEIKIRSWKSNYTLPENMVMLDGTTWELDCTAGNRTRHRYGLNAYPETWDALMQLLSEVCPEGYFPSAFRFDFCEEDKLC